MHPGRLQSGSCYQGMPGDWNPEQRWPGSLVRRRLSHPKNNSQLRVIRQAARITKRMNATPYPKIALRQRVELHAIGVALNNGSGHSTAATMSAKSAKMAGE